MKIMSWNVNSVRARVQQLIDLLKAEEIDVALLQETKCVDEVFPKSVLEDMNYNCIVFGQKAYNGVAVLSKHRVENIVFGNSIFIGDTQARYLECFTNGLTVASVYVPNGRYPGSETYNYKLDFLRRLRSHLMTKNDERFVLAGDFNVAPSDIDVYDPKLWEGKICCTDKEREVFSMLLKDCKLSDSVRQFFGDDAVCLYTWWDYRYSRTFSKNHDKGLRIDHFLSNVKVLGCKIKKEIRGLPRPSDHAPIILTV
jgi:exodeoxyribonuclease-3